LGQIKKIYFKNIKISVIFIKIINIYKKRKELGKILFSCRDRALPAPFPPPLLKCSSTWSDSHSIENRKSVESLVSSTN
jgi:hypothetical protein